MKKIQSLKKADRFSKPQLGLFGLIFAGAGVYFLIGSFAASPLGTSLTFQTLTSTGSSLYVSSSGNDSNSGAINSPFKSIVKALAAVAPNQTIYMRQGSYDCSNTPYHDGPAAEALVRTSGTTASTPITITSYPGEHGTITNCMVWIGASYIKLDNLTIDGQHALDDANIFVTQNAHNVMITNNTIIRGGKTGTNSSNSPSNYQAGSGIYTDHGTANVQITNNVFRDNGTNEFHHGLYLNGTNYLVANNLVYDNSGYGFQLYPGLYSSVVINNTSASNGYSGFVLGGNGSYQSSNNLITNNISAYNGHFGFEMCWDSCGGGGGVGTGNKISNNVNFGNTQGALLSRTDGTTSYTANITTDPKFTNLAGNDYSLQAGSSAIDKATPAYTPPYDFIGAARTGGAGPDIGAYEFGSNANVPGDTNNDGHVSIADLSTFLANFGNNAASNCDFNNDGSVGIADLSILLSHYGI